MQLLSLAGSLLLIIASVAAQSTENVGPCEKQRQDLGKPMPGKFLPQCTEYGFYQAAQCHGSTGRCWCVNPDTGAEIQGTSKSHDGAPECTACNTKRAAALRPVGFVGNYVPTCDKDGLFEPTQHRGSTGESWCVDRYSGEEIPGTRFGPGQQRSKTCEQQARLIGLNMHSMLPQKGPCYAEVVDARGLARMPGFYTPKCTENGFYQTEQRHSSTGYTWCVNPRTGKEIDGTRRGPNEPKADCGACFKEIEQKLAQPPRMGNEMPQCNEENGDYVPVQHREGYSWCANPKTGAVEGKKYPPGDKTPLPCVNN
jgi:nidogen (entactin)